MQSTTLKEAEDMTAKELVEAMQSGDLNSTMYESLEDFKKGTQVPIDRDEPY